MTVATGDVHYEREFQLGSRRVGSERPVYFIADVASNHDGSLERARELIKLAREAGADAVKFQHFRAHSIVSDRGFRELGRALGHQAAWSKPVFEVYRQYELNRDWTEELAATARVAGVDFLTTPYDEEAVRRVATLVPAFKIGSGDIDWLAFIRRVARECKPVLLACGAASFAEVVAAVEAVLVENAHVVLMQCNTNYTGSLENFAFVNLRVLNAFAERWPGMPLGLSDHTPGHATVLGAVTLGARIIEKHFTDDTAREGPDHAFAMTPAAWAEMVARTRELESALGDGVKRVEENERDARIVQRRCVRAARDLFAGAMLAAGDVECLRPAEAGALGADRVEEVVGSRLTRALARGEALRPEDLGVAEDLLRTGC